MGNQFAEQIGKNIKDHIKEVMNLAGKTYRAKLVIPKSMLRNYMLELKLMGVQVQYEEGKENELYIDSSEEAIKRQLERRGGSERLLGSAARISSSQGKSK